MKIADMKVTELINAVGSDAPALKRSHQFYSI